MSSDELHQQIKTLTNQIAARPLDQALQDWLNQEHGTGSATYDGLNTICRRGVDEGWLCQHEAGGIRVRIKQIDFEAVETLHA